MKLVYKIFTLCVMWASLCSATTVLEIKVVCGADLDATKANTLLKGSKIIGKAFDTTGTKKCYILATKSTTSNAERDAAIDGIVTSLEGEDGL